MPNSLSRGGVTWFEAKVSQKVSMGGNELFAKYWEACRVKSPVTLEEFSFPGEWMVTSAVSEGNPEFYDTIFTFELVSLPEVFG